MLAISRKRGQSIIIELPDGRTGTIKTVNVSEGIMRLAFDFPRDVNIAREEIFIPTHAAKPQKEPT